MAARPAHQRALAAQRLAAGVQADDMVAAWQIGGQPAPARPATRRWHGLRRSAKSPLRARPVRDNRASGAQSPSMLYRLSTAIHDRPDAAIVPPRGNRVGESGDVVMRRPPVVGAARGACLRGCWRGSIGQCTIRSPRCGSVASSAELAAKPVEKNSAASLPKKAAASASSASCSGSIAAQQPRSARTDRHARDPAPRASRRPGRRTRQAEVIVRGEIHAAARGKRAQPPACRQPGEFIALGGQQPGAHSRAPNTALPTRTCVAPNRIAVSKSPLIPIDSPARP